MKDAQYWIGTLGLKSIQVPLRAVATLALVVLLCAPSAYAQPDTSSAEPYRNPIVFAHTHYAAQTVAVTHEAKI